MGSDRRQLEFVTSRVHEYFDIPRVHHDFIYRATIVSSKKTVGLIYETSGDLNFKYT